MTATIDAPRWREVLGLHAADPLTRSEINEAYRAKAAIYHPDAGGSVEQMIELTRAREQALAEVQP